MNDTEVRAARKAKFNKDNRRGANGGVCAFCVKPAEVQRAEKLKRLLMGYCHYSEIAFASLDPELNDFGIRILLTG